MENEEIVKEDQDSPEQKADKDTKKYLSIIEVVKKVVGGEGRLRPAKKIDGDTTAELVAELFAEEEVELRNKVKEGLKNLLRQHVQLEADVRNKENELKKLQLEKRKEFTKAANTWLQQINQGAVQQEAYATALETAFKEEKKKED